MTLPGFMIFVIPTSMFLLALSGQMIVWRIKAPENYLYWFLKYWAILPAILATGAGLAIWHLHPAGLNSATAAVFCAGFIGYLALCASFILIYPAISNSSLSLDILRRIEERGPQEISTIKLTGQSRDDMFGTRITNLFTS